VVLNRCVKGSAPLSGIVLAEALVTRLLDAYGRNVDRFVVPSRFYADKLVEWGWPRERFVHVANFVDCGAIAPRYEPGDAFLYFGRLSAEKGLVTLVRAAARARVPLWLAGAGPQRGALEREARVAGADVSFLGHLSGEELYGAVRACRAAVLPSEWYENGPISVLESFAAGKPVIATNIAGIPEHVEAGETGWLFASADVEALAATLRRAADAPDALLRGMGRAARSAAERLFDVPVYKRHMSALYAELGVSIH
jgi:glycosyltransferase involved in cell wall biosynthesis